MILFINVLEFFKKFEFEVFCSRWIFGDYDLWWRRGDFFLLYFIGVVEFCWECFMLGDSVNLIFVVMRVM